MESTLQTERARLEELYRHRVLDTLPEAAFDRITELAAEHFGVPIALVTFVDDHRQWTKACYGFDAGSVDRRVSFCTHVVEGDGTFVIHDTVTDPQHARNPLVTGEPRIRFYAGAPIITGAGHRIGAVCVIDRVPRAFDDRDERFLERLAGMVAHELEHRVVAFSRDELLCAFETNHHPLVAFDHDGRLTFVNDAARTLYGAGKDIIGQPVTALFDYRWLSRDDETACLSAMADNGPWSGEVIHVLNDGRELRVQVHMSPTFDEDGRKTGVMGLIRDVTTEREEERLMRLLLDNAHDMLSLHAPDGSFQYTNHASERVTGFTPQELLGVSGYSVVHPDDRERVRNDSHLKALRGQVVDVTWRRMHRDGHYRWCETRTTPVLGPDGEVQHLITSTRDISDRKAAEDRAVLLESVAVNANDAVLITPARPIDSPDGPKITYVNEAFCQMTGYAPEEVIGRTPRILHGPKTDRRELDRIRHALETWQPVVAEVINYRKDGSEFAVEISIVPAGNDNGWFTHWVSIQRDVTERRAQEERLRLLESAVVNASDAIIISEAEPVDRPGPVVRYVNQAYTRMTGYEPHEIIGQTPRLTQGEGTDGATLARIRKRLLQWQPVNETVLNYRKDGTPFWVNLAITPVADETGWFTHWVSIQRDVTRQRLQHDLERDRRRILEMITAEKSLPDVLQALLLLLEHQLDGTTASIMLLQNDRLHEGVPADLPVEYREVINGLTIGPSVGSCGTAAYTGQTVTAQSIATDERWTAFRDVALAAGLRACWSAPILSKNSTVLGTFAVYAHEERTPKPEETELLEDIARFTAVILERYRALNDMQQLALYDTLTGLPNRALFDELLKKALADHREGQSVVLGMLDIDRFKTVNDTLGHSVGDELLRMVALRLEKNLSRSGVVARMSGDEFTLLLEGVHNDRHLAKLAERVQDAFRAPFYLSGQELFVRGSLGFASYPEDARTPEDLLRLADVAMYHAKGRNLGWVAFGADTQAPIARHVALEAALNRALERDELSLHYQPIMDARTEQPVAVEALLRWNSAEHGFVSPVEFIPISETSGLIIPIGEWILHRACHDAAAMQGVHPDLRFGVNLSIRQFNHPGLVDTVRAALHASGMNPDLLTLEITESVLMDSQDAVRKIEELRALGVRLAIDDFGKGYSSLGYLKDLPVQALKIDKSFVDGIEEDLGGKDARLVRSIVSLCRGLDLRMIAEGVETRRQANFLREAGVHLLQGWLFSKAMPLPQVLAWLSSRRGAAEPSVGQAEAKG